MTTLALDRPPPASRARTGWQVAAPALLGLAAAAGVVALYLVFVRTRLGQVVDEAALQGADVQHPRVVELLSRTLDGSSPLSLAAVALVAAAIGLLRRRVDLAVAAGVLVVGANVTTQALKAQLVRPALAEAAPNSLPSGHTTAAVSVAFALVLVLPYAARAAVALAGAGYVTVIAVATVWAGWHRPSDTVAALLVVLAWGGLIVAVVRARRGRTRRRDDTGRSASRLATVPLTVTMAVAGVAAAAVGLIGLAGWALSGWSVPGLVSDLGAFVAGSAGVTAATAAGFLIWVRLAAGDRPAATPEPATPEPAGPEPAIPEPAGPEPATHEPADASSASAAPGSPRAGVRHGSPQAGMTHGSPRPGSADDEPTLVDELAIDRTARRGPGRDRGRAGARPPGGVRL